MRNFVTLKNYMVMRKIMMAVTLTVVPEDEQRSVILFLLIENVSYSEIHMRMYVMYDLKNVITKSTVNKWVQ